jgi:hypothetical protein
MSVSKITLTGSGTTTVIVKANNAAAQHMIRNLSVEGFADFAFHGFCGSDRTV